MRRIGILSAFLVGNLFRSLLGLVPLATTLGAYTVTFFYRGNKVDYFAAVGGFDLALVCLATTLVMAAQANRAVMYPLLARLPRRAELLAAVLVSSLAITCVMALAFTALGVLQGTIEVTLPEFLVILPRWLALFVFAATIALNLSKLAATAGSRLAMTLLLILVLVAADRQLAWQGGVLRWLVDAAGLIASPLVANMMVEVHGAAPARYLQAVGLPLVGAGLLFLLATWLFRRKDLLWVE